MRVDPDAGQELMNRKVPEQIVHYSRGEPFRTITSVPPDQLEHIIAELDDKNAWGLDRFENKEYLRQRVDVEGDMRARFIELGGSPVLKHPIYFFLGRHDGFEKNPLNVAYCLKLTDLCKDSVSFSYGDTMLSFNAENRLRAGAGYDSPLCNQLFMLDELEELFANPLFPSKPLIVEAHLWIKPAADLVHQIQNAK